jgi:hypothetical protein
MSDPIEDFWLATRCTRLTQRRLVQRLADWTPGEPVPDRFVRNGEPHPLPLPRPDDGLQRLLVARRSAREFGQAPLSDGQLGRLLAAMAALPDGRRPHPSAGGLNALQCGVLLLNARHPLCGRAARYDPLAHALQDAGPCPQWTELAPLLGVAPEPEAAPEPSAAPEPELAPEPAGGFSARSRPGAVLVLAIDESVLLDKYGHRAGRFGLVEVGAAVQSVGLRLAADGLAGYLLGGAIDDDVLAVLDLRRKGVRLGAVLACGTPDLPATPGAGRWQWPSSLGQSIRRSIRRSGR